MERVGEGVSGVLSSQAYVPSTTRQAVIHHSREAAATKTVLAFGRRRNGDHVLLQLPRMNQGFWDDEELNVRTTLYGRFKLDRKSGEVEFQATRLTGDRLRLQKLPIITPCSALFRVYAKMRGIQSQSRAVSIGRVAVSRSRAAFWRAGSGSGRVVAQRIWSARRGRYRGVLAGNSPMGHSLRQ